MASILVDKDVTASTQGTKVTLTNWQRLNNSPIVLPEASAVQWNEYVFVLARDGRALLYHSKHGMWSMLPECPRTLANSNHAVNYKEEIIVWCSCSVVNYKGGITALCSYDLIVFDIHSSQWQELKIKGYQPFFIASNKDRIYAYARKYIQSRSMMYDGRQREEWLLSSDGEAGWKEEQQFPPGTANGSVKLLFTGEAGWYVLQTNAALYYQQLTQSTIEGDVQKKEMIVLNEISSPPLTDSTLHAVKDTLFSFGGRDKDNQPSSDVLRYNPDSDSWDSAGYMRSARYNVVVTTVQQDDNLDVYVMGGSFGNSKYPTTPKLGSSQGTNTQQGNWDDSTSIVEKCAVE